MEERRSRNFTLMVVPETSTGEVKRLRISRRLVYGAGIALGLLTVAGVTSMAAFLVLLNQTRQSAALKVENERLVAQIVEIDTRVEELGGVVDRLDAFGAKLRTMARVSDPARNLAIGPVGVAQEETTAWAAPVPAERAAVALRRSLLGRGRRAARLVTDRAERTRVEAARVLGSVQDLSVFLSRRDTILASTPSRRPTQGYVTSGFGMRTDPFTGLPQRHAGIDYSAPIGNPVIATADGRVIYASRRGAYGKMIEVDHGNGIVTSFAHLSRIHVKVGQKVKRGHVIGAVGNSGRSTGPHVHYEVRIKGVAVDPRRFLLE